MLYNQEETVASCYTCDKSLIRKLDELSAQRSDAVVSRRGDGWAEYQIPKKWVKIRPPKQTHLTEEQKAALLDRLKDARRKRLPSSNNSER